MGLGTRTTGGLDATLLGPVLCVRIQGIVADNPATDVSVAFLVFLERQVCLPGDTLVTPRLTDSVCRLCSPCSFIVRVDLLSYRSGSEQFE